MKKRFLKLFSGILIWACMGSITSMAAEDITVFTDEQIVEIETEEIFTDIEDEFVESDDSTDIFSDEIVTDVVIESDGLETSANDDAGFSIPANDWGYYVSAGDEVEMAACVTVKNGYTVTYKWYLMDDNNDLQLISGVSGDEYTVKVSKDTVYCCLVTDNAGNQEYIYFDIVVESENAQEKDWDIFNDVMIESAVAGDSVKLAPIITGREYSELSYQWYKFEEPSSEKIIDGATKYTYTALDAKEGDSYYCIITDENGNQEKVTFELDVKVPDVATPVVVSVTPVSGKKIKVTWEAVENASGYRIYRKQEGTTSWKKMSDVDYTVTSYTDITPKAGVIYTYTVRAYEKVNETAYWSKYESGKSAAAKTAAPTVFVKELAYNKVQVSWGAVDGAVGYRVYRKVKGASKWTALKKVSSTVNVYTDSTVEPGINYLYTVRGYCKSNGKNLWGYYKSSGVSVITKTAAPALVSAKSQAYNKIKITWKTVGGADGYRVCRKVAGGSWKLLKNVSASTTSYVDTTAVTGTTYYYTIRSFCTIDGKKSLGRYKTSGIKGVAKVAAPKLVSAKITSTKKTKISWNTADGATGYRVYRKTTGGNWKLLKVLKSSTVTSYTDTNAKGKSYVYTVRAYRTVDGENLLGYYSSSGIKSTK